MKEKQVENFFEECLKILEDSMGSATTSEDELSSVGKSLLGKCFRGVSPVDRLPPLKQGQCCIINLDFSGMPGSHWVAVYKHNSQHCIYDSFGRKSSDILSSLSRLKIKDSDYDPEQAVSEDNCGQRSLCWLWCVKQLGIKNAMKL